MKQVPQTASGFENSLKALKKNSADTYAFLRNVPLSKVAGYYKSNEVQTEILS